MRTVQTQLLRGTTTATITAASRGSLGAILFAVQRTRKRREPQSGEFPKARRVVVPQGLGVPERFKYRVGLN